MKIRAFGHGDSDSVAVRSSAPSARQASLSQSVAQTHHQKPAEGGVVWGEVFVELCTHRHHGFTKVAVERPGGHRLVL